MKWSKRQYVTACLTLSLAYINLCWVIGQFLSALILNALVDNPTQWGYRIPFALQV